jgi:urea transport system ATP-binding protein
MLSISNLHIGYGESPVIQDISFTLESGSATAIVGRNGMGKSTLLKAIVGMIPAKSGSIKLDNQELFGLQSFKRVQAGMAYVPQGRMIFPQLTVEENILSGLETKRYDGTPAAHYRPGSHPSGPGGSRQVQGPRGGAAATPSLPRRSARARGP